MTTILCSCGAVLPIHALRRVHLLTIDPEFPLIGGDCPTCGSTRYAPAAECTAEDVALCHELELLGDGRVVMAADLDEAVTALAA